MKRPRVTQFPNGKYKAEVDISVDLNFNEYACGVGDTPEAALAELAMELSSAAAFLSEQAESVLLECRRIRNSAKKVAE